MNKLFFNLLVISSLLASVQGLAKGSKTTGPLEVPKLIFKPDGKALPPLLLVFPKMPDQVSHAPIAISSKKKPSATRTKNSPSK